MDRSDKFGSVEQNAGRAGTTRSGPDYYRQDFSDQDREGMDARDWGFIAAGALMLGIGGYMMLQGTRRRAPELPFTGSSGGQQKRGSVSSSREWGDRSMARGDTPGVQVREQVTINRSVSDLYRFWRNVENLPRVMGYLEDVTKSSDRRSHWVAKGPAGQHIEWDAEVTDARENELVAWRSLEGSEVPNEGSVRFSRSPDGSGTVVDVALTYHPPGGKAGAAVAKLFGREPAQEIRRDLERFKQRVESGNLILASGAYGGSSTGF